MTNRIGHRRELRSLFVASVTSVVLSSASAQAHLAPGDERAESMPSADSDASFGPVLRIEIEPTIDDADLLRGWIARHSLETAKARIPSLTGQEQWIAVAVDGATYDYRVSAVAMRNGESVGPVSEPVACVCNSDELLALVDARIAAAAEELVVDAPAPEPEPSSMDADAEPSQPSEGEPEVPTFEPDRDARRRLGPLGWSGVGLGILGAGALGAGVALVLRPDRPRQVGGSLEHQSTHPPGIAMTIGGGVAFVTGVALLVVDRVRHRERLVMLQPTVDSRWLGLSIDGRF